MPVYEYKKGGKTHYYYSFEVKDRSGNRKTIKQRGFTGKTAAKDAERDARVAWKKGQHVDPSSLTIGDYIVKWLSEKQDVSDETRKTNEGHIQNHIIPLIGGIKVQEFNIRDIKEFIKALNTREIAKESVKRKSVAKKASQSGEASEEVMILSKGTVKKIFNLVQTCFESARIEEVIISNPFNSLDKKSKPQTEKVKIDYWTKEEVKMFLSKVDHRLRLMFVLAIYTGMRRGELLGLRWKDVDFENSRVSIQQTLKPYGKLKAGGKTQNATRSVSLSPSVLAELKAHRAASIKERWEEMQKVTGDELKALQERYDKLDLILCQPTGEPVSLGNFNKFFKRMLNKTNMRVIRFHDLRHTCASLLLGSGAHPKIVQELLGHASIKITLDTYSHMLPNMQEDALKTLDKFLM